MSIHLKALFFSLTILFIVGIIVVSLLWLCLGEINHNHIFIIVVVTVLLSPRFEVITSQSGKSLKKTGLVIMAYNAWGNLKNRKNI